MDLMRILLKILRKLVKYPAIWTLSVLMTPILFTVALIARFRGGDIDVGIGPEPLINNLYHKKALLLAGYTAETYVSHVYFITQDFDYDFSKRSVPLFLGNYWLFIRAIWRYRCLYFYFNGGPLAWTPHKPWEGFILKIAGVRSVVMPYGGDVQDLLRTKNLVFRNAVIQDYPLFQKSSRSNIIHQTDRWIKWGTHIIGGCDWVEYLYHWDTLIPAHFCIDLPSVEAPRRAHDGKVRVFHAPNHKAIKGTEFFQKAVRELQDEGLPLELDVAQGLPNQEILRRIADADIVADQLVIGWYGFFALEAMALGRPVLCHLRQDFIDLYVHSGCFESAAEIGPVSCNYLSVKDRLRELVLNEQLRHEVGNRSREFVKRHHSIEAMSKIFDGINRQVGLLPSLRSR